MVCIFLSLAWLQKYSTSYEIQAVGSKRTGPTLWVSCRREMDEQSRDHRVRTVYVHWTWQTKWWCHKQAIRSNLAVLSTIPPCLTPLAQPQTGRRKVQHWRTQPSVSGRRNNERLPRAGEAGMQSLRLHHFTTAVSKASRRVQKGDTESKRLHCRGPIHKSFPCPFQFA